uniref:Uncharacterized protein n=1 Tax=Anguilla anguilla TaxID=7936 RepID=A0A0E9R3X3_ANGAN
MNSQNVAPVRQLTLLTKSGLFSTKRELKFLQPKNTGTSYELYLRLQILYFLNCHWDFSCLSV